MNWIYGLEKEGMQLWKDRFISKPTCYITLYSTLTPSDRLVTRARAAAYTKNNILSAFEATGIWPLNPRKVFLRQSRNSIQFESPPHYRIFWSQPETEMSCTAGGGDVFYSWRRRCLVQSQREISWMAGDADVSYGRRWLISNDYSLCLKDPCVPDDSDGSDGTSYPVMENYTLPVAQATGRVAFIPHPICGDVYASSERHVCYILCRGCSFAEALYPTPGDVYALLRPSATFYVSVYCYISDAVLSPYMCSFESSAKCILVSGRLQNCQRGCGV